MKDNQVLCLELFYLNVFRIYIYLYEYNIYQDKSYVLT